MLQQTMSRKLAGKTIEKAFFEGDYIVLTLTDGTFACFEGTHWADTHGHYLREPEINLTPDEHGNIKTGDCWAGGALVKAGVYTVEEAQAAYKQVQAIGAQRQLEQKRRDFERLKRELNET